MDHLLQLVQKSAFGPQLRKLAKLIPTGSIVPIVSGPLKGMRWVVGSSNHGCWLGTYETEKLSIIRQWIKPGMVVYDLGAHVGEYSMIFSKEVGPTGKVFAFEPFGENAVNLLKHIQLNNLDNVVLVQAATSNRSGLGVFSVHASNYMGSLAQETSGPIMQVPIFSLDSLVNELGFPVPNLIKMDVEGAESNVLSGANNLLKESCSIWFIALHSDEQKQKCLGILSDYKYNLFALDGSKIKTSLDIIAVDEIYALPDN